MKTDEERRNGVAEMWSFVQDDESYARIWDQFMTPKLDAWGRYWSVRSSYGGSFIVDAGELVDFAKETAIDSCDYLGIGARVRLSANGFMDATDWEYVADGNELGAWFDQELEALGDEVERERMRSGT